MKKYQLLNNINAHAGEWLSLCDLDNYILSLDSSLMSAFEHTGENDIIANGALSYELDNEDSEDNIPEWLDVKFDIVKHAKEDGLSTIISLKGAEIL